MSACAAARAVASSLFDLQHFGTCSRVGLVQFVVRTTHTGSEATQTSRGCFIPCQKNIHILFWKHIVGFLCVPSSTHVVKPCSTREFQETLGKVGEVIDKSFWMAIVVWVLCKLFSLSCGRKEEERHSQHRTTTKTPPTQVERLCVCHGTTVPPALSLVNHHTRVALQTTEQLRGRFRLWPSGNCGTPQTICHFAHQDKFCVIQVLPGLGSTHDILPWEGPPEG